MIRSLTENCPIVLLHIYVCSRGEIYMSDSDWLHDTTCTESRRLTLRHDAGQSSLELVFGLFHLLFMLALLTRQAADVAVGGLDHGVEVVGVPAVDLTSLQPGQEDAHRFRKLAVVWPRTEDTKEEWVASLREHKNNSKPKICGRVVNYSPIYSVDKTALQQIYLRIKVDTGDFKYI